MRTYSSGLKIAAGVTLAFFLWSFGPLFQIAAWAATPEQPRTAQARKEAPKPASVAERLQTALDGIREKSGQAAAKAEKGEDGTAEMISIRAKKAELGALADEIRVELAATEKKIAALPQEIRDRHRRFTRHFEDNVRTLNANLADVEGAKTKADRKAKIEKVRLHLEKTKAPSRHQKLDPQNLPFRARKVTKTVAPRLKKEEFEKDFPKHKSQGKQKTADSRLMPDLLSSRRQYKPVLLAFNEYASDVSLSLGAQSATPSFAFFDAAPLLIAQAVDAPTADDLSETPEVQFTDAVRAKALELGCSPVKLYEFTRNEIFFTPTYGSIQGADMCLQTRECNAFDASSLLISMLRSCNIPAHYVTGTIEVPIDKIMNWVGNFTDPMAAATLISSGGIPGKLVISGGKPTKIQMEHTWVETFVSYGPYSGRPSNLNAPKIWVPLDPSFKQYNYTDGLDMQTVVPFDGQAFANQVLSTATTNETEGFITNVDSNYIQATMTNYQAQIQNYINQNIPNATAGDIIGKKEIKKQELGILPVTLPYKTVTAGVKYSEIPDNLRHKISINLLDENGYDTVITVTKALPEVAGQKITLSYAPASSSDESILLSFANSTTNSFPSYLINLKPELRIDGQLIATGKSIGMAQSLPFNIIFTSPVSGANIISNNNTVGTYTAIVLDLGVTVSNQLDKLAARVKATKTKIDSNDLSGITKDDIMGDFLFGVGLSYWGLVDFSNQIASQVNRVADVRLPSEGIFTYDLKTYYAFDIPISAIPSGFTTDIDADQHIVVAKNGDASKELTFMTTIGILGSRMEASIYDLTFNKAYTGRGISTAHIFEYANQQGIPLYTIDSSNINAVLPTLTL